MISPARIIRFVYATAVVAGITIALSEATLRLAPQVIPLTLLVHFNPDLRAYIAESLGYPHQRGRRTVARDDDGVPLWLPAPGQTVVVRSRDPGAVERMVMDWRGFCNPREKSHKDYRAELVALGDSFTWCTSVRATDTWAHRLSRLGNFSTYNVSTPAIGPYEYVQLLKAYGLAMQPRAVLMTIYEGNDLRDALKHRRYVDEVAGNPKNGPMDGEAETEFRHGDELSVLGQLYFATLDGPLGRISYAVNVVLTATNLASVSFRAAVENAQTGRATGLGAPEGGSDIDFRYRIARGKLQIAFNSENTDRDEVEHARMLAEGETDFSVFDAALAEFVALSRDLNFEPIIVYAPSAHTAYARHVTFTDTRLADVMPAFSLAQRQYFAKKARELGYRFVDPTAALQDAAEHATGSELLYFPGNLHFSAGGHRVFAAALADELSDLRR